MNDAPLPGEGDFTKLNTHDARTSALDRGTMLVYSAVIKRD